MTFVSRATWAAGWPARTALLLLIGAYRITLGQLIGGNCRFYPTCSGYAQQAIRELGAVRGSFLAAWRILRCSPLSPGGVDHPPARKERGQAALGAYEGIIPESAQGATRAGAAR